MDSFTMPTLALALSSDAKSKAKAKLAGGVLVLNGVAHAVPYTLHVPINTSASAEDKTAVEEQLHDVLDAEFALAERAFSPFSTTSNLSRVNHGAAGEWIPVSNEFLQVLELCSALFKWSAGAFDPVAAKSTGVEGASWATSIEFGKSPTDGSARVRRLAEGIKLDLSAVSKGWCVDRLAERLAATTLRVAPLTPGSPMGACYVDWGGDIRAIGLHPSGRPWACAVQPPPSVATISPPTLTTIELEDAAACTSGSYAGIRDAAKGGDGDGMQHLVRTGSSRRFPEPTSEKDSIVTCTVVHSSCAVADALATTFATLKSVDALRSFLGTKSWPTLHAALEACGVSTAGQRFELFRVAITTRDATGKLVDCVEMKTTARPTATLDNIRAAVAGRVHAHVALVLPLPGVSSEKACLAMPLTSFIALGRSSVAEAAFFAMEGTRLHSAVSGWYAASGAVQSDAGVLVYVVQPLTEHARTFVTQSADVTLHECSPVDLLAASNVDGCAVKRYRLSPAEPFRVGTHACCRLAPCGSATNGLPQWVGTADHVTTLLSRRANRPFNVAIPKAIATKATGTGNAVPFASHTAVATAWVPKARGLLATTVAGVDFTSRDPCLLTFSAKRSAVDALVFVVDAVVRLHLFDEGTNGEDSLTSWFDDGSATDSATQFMYVAGARSEADAKDYTFSGPINGTRYPWLDVRVVQVVDDTPSAEKGSSRVLVVAAPVRAPVAWVPRKALDTSDVKSITSWTIL